jgi:hypothetical protein
LQRSIGPQKDIQWRWGVHDLKRMVDRQSDEKNRADAGVNLSPITIYNFNHPWAVTCVACLHAALGWLTSMPDRSTCTLIEPEIHHSPL